MDPKNEQKRVYTGAAGWGKLDPVETDEVVQPVQEEADPKSSVQQLMFSIHDPLKVASFEFVPAPVAKERVHKHRSGVRHKDRFFNFEQAIPQILNVIPAPEPEFQDKTIRKRVSFPMQVKRPDGDIVHVPESVEATLDLYNIKQVATEVIAYRSEQMRALILSQEIPDNMFFEADTSFGKTLVELLVAGSALSKNQRVLLVTTREDLIFQIADEASLFLNLPENACVTVSGEVARENRLSIYSNLNHRLIISTPKSLANDLDAGVIKPEDFQLGIFDEGHRGVGNTGYIHIGKYFSAAGIPMRLFSATLPDKDYRLNEMLTAFGIKNDKIFKLYSDEKALFEKTSFHDLKDETMCEVANQLYTEAANTAINFVRSMQALSRTSTGVKVAETAILEKFLKMTKLNKGRFEFPRNDDMAHLGKMIQAAVPKSSRRLARAFSLWAEFGYRINLYYTLARFGRYAFLSYVGQEIWAYRFNCTRRNGKPKGLYFKSIYRGINKNSSLAKMYRKLCPGKLFAQLASKKTVGTFARQLGLAPKSGETWPTPQKVRDKFFEKAMLELVEDDEWYDGPLTERNVQVVERHTTFGKAAQIISYVESVDCAQLWSKLFEKRLKAVDKKAVPFVGVRTLSSEERTKNLNEYKNGSASVITGTSAIREGLNLKATVLIVSSHDPSTSAIKQLRGRIARKEGEVGILYNEIVMGTPDYQRFYGGWNRIKKEQGIAQASS